MIPIGAEEPFIPLVQPVPETSGPQVIELWVPEDEGPNRINAIKAKITEKFVVIQDLGSKLAFRISTFTLFKGKVQTVAENEVRRSDLTSFTCFQFLPVEIRLKIFKLAFEPQLVLWQGAKFLGPPEFQRSFQMKDLAGTQKFVRTIPPIALVCKEAYGEARCHYTPFTVYRSRSPLDFHPLDFFNVVIKYTPGANKNDEAARKIADHRHSEATLLAHEWVHFKDDIFLFGNINCPCYFGRMTPRCACIWGSEMPLAFPTSSPGKIVKVAFMRSLWDAIIRRAQYNEVIGVVDANPFCSLRGVQEVYIVWEARRQTVKHDSWAIFLFNVTMRLLAEATALTPDQPPIELRFVKPVYGTTPGKKGMLLGWKDVSIDLSPYRGSNWTFWR